MRKILAILLVASALPFLAVGAHAEDEYVNGRDKIIDFKQTAFEFRKFGLGRLAVVARCLGGCRSRLCGSARASPGLAERVHVRGSLLLSGESPNPPEPKKAPGDDNIAILRRALDLISS